MAAPFSEIRNEENDKLKRLEFFMRKIMECDYLLAFLHNSISETQKKRDSWQLRMKQESEKP